MAVYIPNIDVEEFYKICKEHGIEIIAVPAADVQPVVRGKWVQVMGKYDWMVKCSRCNGVPLETSNFCPNCGADMRRCPEDEAAEGGRVMAGVKKYTHDD